MSSASDDSMQQIAAHVAHELIEMKTQSSSTAAYLRESAAQVEILQLQTHHPCPSANEKPDGIQLIDSYTYSGSAMHALQNIISCTCSSKPLFQDSSVPEFTQENFNQLAPPGLQLEVSAETHSNSIHGIQGVASHTSDSRMSLIDDTPEPLNEVEQAVSNNLLPQTRQPPMSEMASSPETEIVESQTCINVSEEVQTIFCVKTLLEANNALQNFEKQTGTKYSAYKSTAGFGNTVASVYQPDKPHKIYFEERSADMSGLGIPYDGIPFINVGKKVMDCQYGMDRCIAAKRKYAERQLRDISRQRRPLAQERTKKIKCRAQIRMKEILKYPDFKAPLDSNSRKEKVRLSRELRESLKSGTAKGEKRIYIQLPRLSDHKGHPLGENAVKEVKPCLSGKQAIKEVNTLSWDAFIQRFGNVVEHGQVVASAAWAKRPFANMRALHSAFCEFLDTLTQSGKEAMFRCYPNLQINFTTEPLSTDSASDVQAIQLFTRTPEDAALLAELNTKYRENLNFSYIVCLREMSKEELLTGLHARTQNPRDVEILNALEEVKKIAWYRILDRVRTVKPLRT